MVRQLPVWLHTFHYGNFGAEMNRSMRAERVLCRRANRLIAVSDAQRLSLIPFYGIPESRITTVINGVADNPFADEAGAIRQRKVALGLDAEAIVVGCLAVLSEQKGIRYLLDGADRILRHDERVRVLVVGGGPLEESLRKQAAAISETRIVFTGWRQDAAELLPVFDVFVMSSLWEAMPMVLLESMAARRPIVVTDVGENRKIVDGGRCGLVIPPRDPDAIASAVISLLERPEEAGALAARAQARFRERYTIRAMVTAYEALFDEFLLPRGVVAMVG
jgi:glycosyltransferase involved in cell wall biosynthesis